MTSLTRFALRQPAITILLMLLLLLGGTAAGFSLNQELTPPVEFPQASIVTIWPGASANEVTEEVVKPIEDALEGITDVDVVEVSASASEGFSAVTVLAEYGVDQDALRDAIDAELEDVDLPEDAEDPEVLLFSFSDLPVFQASVRGQVEALEDLVLLQRLVEDEIVPELESIEGVSEVALTGGREEKIFLRVDPDALSERGASLSSIRNSLGSNDLGFPAGTLEVEGQALPLQVVHRVESLDDVADLAISGGQGGSNGPSGRPPAATSRSSDDDGEDSPADDQDLGTLNAAATIDLEAMGIERTEVDGQEILAIPLPQAAVDLGYETTADLTPAVIGQLELLQPQLLRDVSEQLIENLPAAEPPPITDAVREALPDEVQEQLEERLDALEDAEIAIAEASADEDTSDEADEDDADEEGADEESDAVDEDLPAVWRSLGIEQASDIGPELMGLVLATEPDAVADLSAEQLLDLPRESARLLPLPFVQRLPEETRDELLPLVEAAARDRSGEGPLRIADVAEVERAAEEPETLNRTDGTVSLSLIVYKEQDANTVNVVNDLLDRIDEWDDDEEFDDYPDFAGEDLEFNTIFEQASYIEESLSGVRNEGILGGIFAVLVILIFLAFSVRSTLVVALSIPLSILAALLLMRVQGLTLNLLTLAGLTIAIGRVVDDTIVVLENIYRHIQRGDDLRESVIEGTREVATAITAATLVAVAVFLPLGFVGGITSEFFLPFGLTTSYALLASLLVAVTVVPLLARRLLRKEVLPEERETALQRLYVPSLEWALDHRWATLILALLFFLATLGLLGAIDQTFLPSFGEPSVTVELQMPPGTDLASTDAVAIEVEELLADTDGIDSVETTVGRGSQFFGEFSGADASRAFFYASLDGDDEDEDGDEDGFFSELFGDDEDEDDEDEEEDEDDEDDGFLSGLFDEDTDASDLAETVRDDLDELRVALVDADLIDSTGAVTFTVSGGAAGGPEGNAFDLQIRSDDEDLLTEANAMILEALRDEDNWEDQDYDEIPLLNLTSNLTEARDVISVQVNPDLATQEGLSTIQVGLALRQIVEGEDLGDVELIDEEGESETLEVFAVYPDDSIESVDGLADLEIDTPSGDAVRLGDIAEIREAPGPVQITRIAGQRAALLSAEIDDSDTFGVLDAADAIIEDLDIEDEFDDEVEVGAGVQSSQQREGFADMLLALPISIIIVYLIMVVAFGSLIHPFTILFSLPFAISGALVALFVTGRPLSLSSLIGVMMLIGIVTTNAIVLVDLVQQYRDRGMDARTALLRGGSNRLRPILMTALATIFALIPQAIGLTEGALIASELATTVIGGLFTSTVLTLIVVPVVYSLLDGLANRGGDWTDGGPETGPDGPAGPSPTGPNPISGTPNDPATSTGGPAPTTQTPQGGASEEAIDTYNEVLGGEAQDDPNRS